MLFQSEENGNAAMSSMRFGMRLHGLGFEKFHSNGVRYRLELLTPAQMRARQTWSAGGSHD